MKDTRKKLRAKIEEQRVTISNLTATIEFRNDVIRSADGAFERMRETITSLTADIRATAITDHEAELLEGLRSFVGARDTWIDWATDVSLRSAALKSAKKEHRGAEGIKDHQWTAFVSLLDNTTAKDVDLLDHTTTEGQAQ